MLFRLFALAACTCFQSFAQYPYVLRHFAGSEPFAENVQATTVYFDPLAVAAGPGGNVYILTRQKGILKVDASGTISTFVPNFTPRSDSRMVWGLDGKLYVLASNIVWRLSPDGTSQVVLGSVSANNTIADGASATSGRFPDFINDLAVNLQGDMYLITSTRVRKVDSATGILSAVTGNQTTAFTGDDVPAVGSPLNGPRSLAVSPDGALYIGEFARIRKVQNGRLTTVAGTGVFGTAQDTSLALNARIGIITAMAADSNGKLYFYDSGAGMVLSLSGDSFIKTINFVAGSLLSRGYADGPATQSNLKDIRSISPTDRGTLLLAEGGTGRIREVANNRLTTIAGRIHFAGEDVPAKEAVLHYPRGIAAYGPNEIFIDDAFNYRLREVKAGKIKTVLGSGVPFGGLSEATTFPSVQTILREPGGSILTATTTQVFRVSANGQKTIIAGTGFSGNSGNGGPAIAATFQFITGLAVNAAGDIFVLDASANVIRRISASDKIIRHFAGTGVRSYSGDGTLATTATFNFFTSFGNAMAFDSTGNLYLADAGNNRIRVIAPSGLIDTIAGTGQFGFPTENALAKTSPLPQISELAFDAAGYCYLQSANGYTYRIGLDGRLQYIAGLGALPHQDGMLATLAWSLTNGRMAVEASGDLFLSDPNTHRVFKAIYNSPASLSTAGGTPQRGIVGQLFPELLKVQVNGRAGVGVGGVRIKFSLRSGDATLTAATAVTDASGVAGIGVRALSAGSIEVLAEVEGQTLTPVRFVLEAAPASAACTLGRPVLTSVRQAGDFGGSETISHGTWLELTGTNLGGATRSWEEKDFSAGTAPSALEGTSVTIEGKAAFIAYVSPTQVNVQAPSLLSPGNLPVIVSNCAGRSEAKVVKVEGRSPGLLAPAAFLSEGKQYPAMLYPDGAFAGPVGLVSGATFREPKPGDTITAFGIGFGTTSPFVPAGTVTSGTAHMQGVQVSIGNANAPILFGGLTPGTIGLYQINLTVPDLSPGDHPILVTVGGVKGQQELYVRIGLN